MSFFFDFFDFFDFFIESCCGFVHLNKKKIILEMQFNQNHSLVVIKSTQFANVLMKWKYMHWIILLWVKSLMVDRSVKSSSNYNSTHLVGSTGILLIFMLSFFIRAHYLSVTVGAIALSPVGNSLSDGNPCEKQLSPREARLLDFNCLTQKRWTTVGAFLPFRLELVKVPPIGFSKTKSQTILNGIPLD